MHMLKIQYLPIIPIGTQHMKSVVTTSSRFLATTRSVLRLVEHFILLDVFRTSINMRSCPTVISTNVSMFRPMKTSIEYNHPGGRSLVRGKARHTPDLE